MDKLLNKLKEYLQMESEISLEEFANYYQETIDYLNENFDNLEKEDSLKGRYIVTILALNAGDRSKRKDKNAKKYKKMWEKSRLWADAFDYRLKQMGMTQDEIDASHEQYNSEV
ncbi:MAG: hypothetical protein SCK28_06345 [Bacillota bacterium]|nr:hypothetical protein [Bacillota bacterium]